jgi:hypothetical protein
MDRRLLVRKEAMMALNSTESAVRMLSHRELLSYARKLKALGD